MNIMNKITLKGLKKNRTRTIVTIIGVILSAAMITGVTTFISSLQSYIVKVTIADEGDWHGAIYNIKIQDYHLLKDDNEVEDIALTRGAGFSQLPESQNEYKPYLYILEMNEQAFETLPVNLLQGRLPINENEVLIPEHIYSNGGVSYQVGDAITLEVGQRTLQDGSVLLENGELIKTEEESIDSENLNNENTINEDVVSSNNQEELVIKGTRTFTIVGICQRLSYELEDYSAAGYTIITALNEENIKETDMFSAYIKAKTPKNIYPIIEEYTGNQNEFVGYDYNYELLRFIGASNENNFNSVFYSLGAILIALIMVGSISLIYNSFAISVSERKKQFGLLSSAGATAKQRMNSVFFEAIVIAAIGIPIGVLSGITGIGVTLFLLRDMMNSLLNTGVPVTLALSVSIPSVIIAVLVALVTILLSAYIPARRSKKISPMDAIRQTADIKLTAKQLKTSKLTRKLYGLEGDLALKNLKRSRRRYRSTVISLFISVVLFIAASSFAMYLKDSVTNVFENMAYDLSFYASNDNYEESELLNVYHDIIALEGIEQGSILEYTNGTVKLTKDQVDEEYYHQMEEQGYLVNGTEIMTGFMIYSVDHETYQAYCKELGLTEDQLGAQDETTGILIDQQHFYNSVEQRYNNTKILKDESLLTMPFYWMDEVGEEFELDITVASFADKVPFGVPHYSYGYSLMLIIDEEQKDKGFSDIVDGWYSTNMYFAAKDPNKSEQDIKSLLLAAGMPTVSLYNEAKELQDNRNIITIISVFAYGFITLISLITLANVFNTISTNVNLRRREFAMLKSVGMTNHGFNKMLNYECIFYGLKALLYGLPVSVGITYLIYLSIEFGVEMKFYVPIQSILISIFSVFFVVFVSMMYSMRKIRNENVLDALKNENL